MTPLSSWSRHQQKFTWVPGSWVPGTIAGTCRHVGSICPVKLRASKGIHEYKQPSPANIGIWAIKKQSRKCEVKIHSIRPFEGCMYMRACVYVHAHRLCASLSTSGSSIRLSCLGHSMCCFCLVCTCCHLLKFYLFYFNFCYIISFRGLLIEFISYWSYRQLALKSQKNKLTYFKYP